MRVALQYVSADSEEEGEKKKKKSKGELRVHIKDGKYFPNAPDGNLPSTFCKV